MNLCIDNLILISGRSFLRSTGYFSFLSVVLLSFLSVLIGWETIEARTLKLGHTVPPSHVWHKVADRFATNLADASGGNMKIKINPLSKLGTEPQMVSMLQSGALQFSILPVGVMSNREASMLAWFLPYLFDNVEKAGAAADLPASRQMLKNLEKHGLVGIGYTFAGMRHVLSVEPITSPEDLAKKKIRAFPSPIFNDWWSANGAAATALPLGEIAPSLTTNLLDAVDVDLDIVVGLKFHQQAGNLALTNHMAFPGVLLASKKWWDSLADEQRQMILGVYKEAEAWGIQTQAVAEGANLERLKADGVTVTRIDLSSFKRVGEKISAAYIKKNELIKQFAEQAQGAK